MKLNRLFLCAFAIFAASSANAAPNKATGHSDLVIYPDNSGQIIEIYLTSYGDTITGTTSFGNGMISLTRENGGWKGWAYGQNFDFTCDQSACNGLTSQGGSDMTLQHDNTGGVSTEKLDGSLNFSFVNASYSSQEITVSADGSLDLTANSDGSFDGTGVLPGRAQLNTFSAHLEGDGDLAQITDPALFVIYLVAPFVHSQQ